VIAAQQSDALGITQLQAQKESHNLDRLGASVDVIADKEEGGIPARRSIESRSGSWPWRSPAMWTAELRWTTFGEDARTGQTADRS
jgi:hypothetical protein